MPDQRAGARAGCRADLVTVSCGGSQWLPRGSLSLCGSNLTRITDAVTFPLHSPPELQCHQPLPGPPTPACTGLSQGSQTRLYSVRPFGFSGLVPESSPFPSLSHRLVETHRSSCGVTSILQPGLRAPSPPNHK